MRKSQQSFICDDDLRGRSLTKKLPHTWLIQGGNRSFVRILAKTNHLPLGVRLQHMVLFPDFVVANGFCADLARLDDMFLLALNDVQQVIGFPRSRVVCFEHFVNLGRLL